MDINENLTVEQQNRRDSFYRLINRIEIFQGAISPEESDFLKATYNPDEQYRITFTTNDDSRMYEATYKGGELVRLIPENEDLFHGLQTGLKDDLAEKEKTTILNISNPTVEIEESISQKIIQPTPYSVSDLSSNELNKILSNDNLVEIQKSLNEFNKKVDVLLEQEKSLYESLEDYSNRTEQLEEHPQLRDEYKEEVLLKVDEFNHMLENSIDRLNGLEQLQSVTQVISNINYQTLREENMLESLYYDEENFVDVTGPVKSINSLNPEMPFQRGFEQRFEEEQLQGSSFALSLAMNHQITNPKEQVKLHLMNYRNIQDFINQPYQPLDKEQLENLRQFSYQSMERAVNVVNKEFAKNHEQSPLVNRTIVLDSKATIEKQQSFDKLYNELRPVAMLQEKQINVFNIAELSSGYNSQVSDHWHKETLKVVDNYLMTNTSYPTKNDNYISLDEIDKGINVLTLKGVQRTDIQNEELKQHLETINNTIGSLNEKLELLEPHENRKEVVQMLDYMEKYYENIIENQLTIEDKGNMIQEVYQENNGTSFDYKQLIERIAELEKMVSDKEKKNLFNDLSDNLKNNVKNELEKMQQRVEKISEQISAIKGNFKQFTYGKMESVYKVAFKAIDKLDQKVQSMKTEIEKDLEDVKEKMQEKPKEKVQTMEIER